MIPVTDTEEMAHVSSASPGGASLWPVLELPAEDRQSSPFTGYTRAHWVAVADHLVGAAWRWASDGGAHLNLPGPASSNGVQSDGLQGFSRSMLAAAFRVRGAEGSDPHGWLQRCAEGLRAGTAPSGSRGAEPWPSIRDHDTQGQPKAKRAERAESVEMAEAATIALSLRLTQEWLWDQLDEQVQDTVESWLRGALHSLPAPDSSYLHPDAVAGFLDSVGRGDELTAATHERAMHLLEGWDRGQGWYTDGDGHTFDHHNGWTMHLLPVLDAHLRREATVHGSRLEEFLQDFRHFFGRDGAPLHMGRSLTSRFGAAAAVALGAVTGDTPMAPGESKRLLNSTLKYFLDRGSLTEHGLPSLGWHGPHPATAQPGDGPASPLWACTALVGLLLPEDAPLWSAAEAQRPLDHQDIAFGLEPTCWAIQATRDDGIMRVHNHGSDNMRPHQGEDADEQDPLYGRIAYSTHTGPTSGGDVADNLVSVRLRGQSSVRRRIHPLGAGGGGGWAWAGSWHRPIFPGGSPTVPGLRVESFVVARGADEVRIDRILGAAFTVEVQHTGWAVCPEGELSSTLESLHGWEPGERLTAPGGTAFAPWCVIPCLRAAVNGSAVLVSLARLSGDRLSRDGEAERADVGVADSASVTDLTVTSEAVTFRWADEELLTTVRFDPAEAFRHDAKGER